MGTPDLMGRDPAAGKPWLSIVGIGEDGLAGLSTGAREAIATAEIVFGGKRHLDLAGGRITGEMRRWPSPFSIDPVIEARGRRVCVLASGDPFFFGVGNQLAGALNPGEWRAFVAPSSVALAGGHLGWALAEATILSLHGRPIELVRPHLYPGSRILILTSDGEAPAKIAALLKADGFGPTRLTVLEALGGPREKVRFATADSFDLGDVDPLNLLALEVAATPGTRLPSLAPGLPDDWFEHDGQITKRDIRALTLSALNPHRGELLWDIGAGSGSIGIEWLLRDPSLRAVAVEGNTERAGRIRLNAQALGVPGLQVVEGRAPDALADLPTPDVVFIGGGVSEETIAQAQAALRPGGRLVINAVALETEALLIAHHGQEGGDLVRLSLAHGEALGNLRGWRSAMPVTQWRWSKP
ncbi:precorrin-6y C5,15-methyltransferase (decarboxylating) subunit CbiE [Lacibacterium aquatile]|uniref:Precorrin-6y C5,15-methyltransferase (Decarboxylating) subunit CbiE n=1 Tax=Lacibacterium aquatile TaxID=1168082 RepID=A0ABW5DRX6_9PROT